MDPQANHNHKKSSSSSHSNNSKYSFPNERVTDDLKGCSQLVKNE